MTEHIYFLWPNALFKQALWSSCSHRNWFRKIDPKPTAFCVHTYCICKLQRSVFIKSQHLLLTKMSRLFLTLMLVIMLFLTYKKTYKTKVCLFENFCLSQCVTTLWDTFTLLITKTGQFPSRAVSDQWRMNEKKQAVCDSTASLLLEYSLLLKLTGKRSYFIHFRHCNSKLHNLSSVS